MPYQEGGARWRRSSNREATHSGIRRRVKVRHSSERPDARRPSHCVSRLHVGIRRERAPSAERGARHDPPRTPGTARVPRRLREVCRRAGRRDRGTSRRFLESLKKFGDWAGDPNTQLRMGSLAAPGAGVLAGTGINWLTEALAQSNEGDFQGLNFLLGRRPPGLACGARRHRSCPRRRRRHEPGPGHRRHRGDGPRPHPAGHRRDRAAARHSLHQSFQYPTQHQHSESAGRWGPTRPPNASGRRGCSPGHWRQGWLEEFGRPGGRRPPVPLCHGDT